MSQTVTLNDILGSVLIRDMPPRIEGDDLILRGRVTVYRGDGTIAKDVVHENVRVLGAARMPWMFYSPTSTTGCKDET